MPVVPFVASLLLVAMPGAPFVASLLRAELGWALKASCCSRQCRFRRSPQLPNDAGVSWLLGAFFSTRHQARHQVQPTLVSFQVCGGIVTQCIRVHPLTTKPTQSNTLEIAGARSAKVPYNLPAVLGQSSCNSSPVFFLWHVQRRILRVLGTSLHTQTAQVSMGYNQRSVPVRSSCGVRSRPMKQLCSQRGWVKQLLVLSRFIFCHLSNLFIFCRFMSLLLSFVLLGTRSY